MGASVCRHNLLKRKWQETYSPLCHSRAAQALGSEEGNVSKKKREKPASMSQKHPCLVYSKLVSIPRSPQLVKHSSHMEKPLMASSLSHSASYLPQPQWHRTDRNSPGRFWTLVRVRDCRNTSQNPWPDTFRWWLLSPCSKPNSVVLPPSLNSSWLSCIKWPTADSRSNHL